MRGRTKPCSESEGSCRVTPVARTGPPSHPAMTPIFELLVQVIELYKFVLIIAVIMSWLVAFNVINTHNRFVYTVNDVLYRITEPALRPIRRFVPQLGGVDISPIVLILLLWFVQRMIEVNILYA